MPIPLPNLDDRSFTDLVEEMRALIPRYAPTWTDHNLSDPGITLIDLFAWLSEALMYRLNRITTASEARYLELLGVEFKPAKPATVKLVITATGLVTPLLIPRGTPVLVRSGPEGNTLRFETVQSLQLTPEDPGGPIQARQVVLVQNEYLGTSNGQPHQVFPVGQPFLIPNPIQMLPRVTVASVLWTFRSSLLTSRSSDHHFTVEPRLSSIRFGDSCLGQIPSQGANITVSYYATLGNQGNVPAGTTFAMDKDSSQFPASLKEALRAGVLFSTLSQTDGSGGTDPTDLDEARQQAIGGLKQRWRAITAKDFEKVVLRQASFKIARVQCVPERDLTAADPDTPRPGHVSVVIVPDAAEDRPTPTPECIDQVWDFLDKRRLITCRHHVLDPGYTEVQVRAKVVRDAQIPESTVRGKIQKNLRALFHPLKGGPGPDKKGWPFGREIYVSEVYQVMESTEGVDYVEAVNLYTREEGGDWTQAGEQVAIAPRNLVHFDVQSSEIMVRTSP